MTCIDNVSAFPVANASFLHLKYRSLACEKIKESDVVVLLGIVLSEKLKKGYPGTLTFSCGLNQSSEKFQHLIVRPFFLLD